MKGDCLQTRAPARRLCAWGSVAALALAGLAALPARAHIPHDNVKDISTAGPTVLAAVRKEFYLSRDGGLTWARQTRGVACGSRGRTDYDAPHSAQGRAVALSGTFAADGTAYLACSGRLFRTEDGGRSYAPVDAPTDARLVDILLAPDFQASGRLVAHDVTGRMFRSPDRGETWRAVPAMAGVTALHWSSGGLVAGTGAGEVSLSGDGGATWQALGRLEEGRAVVDLLPHDPAIPATGVLVATDDGIRRLGPEDAAVAGLAGVRVSGLSRVAGPDGALLFATTWRDGVRRSRDGGESWEPAGQGLQTVPQAVNFDQPDFRDGVDIADGALLLAGFDGLYRSDNGGARWYRLDMTMGHVVALDTVAGADGGTYLGVAPYVAGILVSPDGGTSWTFRYNGIDARRTALAFTPTFPEGREMLSGNRRTLSVRDADSARWESLQLELVEGMETGTQVPTPLAILPSPDFAHDGTVFAGLSPHGVLRSRDRGAHFELVLTGAGASTSGIVSPDFARDDTVFMSAGGDIHVSRDGGDSWTRVWTSPADRLELAHGRGDGPGIGTVFAAGPDFLVWSRDGGTSWSEIALPPTRIPVLITAFAVSPTFATDGRVYLQMQGAGLRLGTRRPDGFDWRPADMPRGHEISRLTYIDAADLFAFSPRFAEDRTMYAGAGEVLLTSRDGGQTWDTLPLLPRRYEAEYALSPYRSVPVDISAGWTHVRPVLPDSNATRDRIRRFVLRTLYWPEMSEVGTSGEQALQAGAPGATMRLTFVGTGTTVIGPRGPALGQARLTLDGVEIGVIDQYAPEREYQVDLHTVAGLPFDVHTLDIAVAGTRNAAARGEEVVIDAFQITR